MACVPFVGAVDALMRTFTSYDAALMAAKLNVNDDCVSPKSFGKYVSELPRITPFKSTANCIEPALLSRLRRSRLSESDVTLARPLLLIV